MPRRGRAACDEHGPGVDARAKAASGGLLAGALLGIEAFLHGPGGFELEHLLGGDLDSLTGPGIAPLRA